MRESRFGVIFFKGTFLLFVYAAQKEAAFRHAERRSFARAVADATLHRKRGNAFRAAATSHPAAT